MTINFYSLNSNLHGSDEVHAVTKELVRTLCEKKHDVILHDISKYNDSGACFFVFETGGTEEMFKAAFEKYHPAEIKMLAMPYNNAIASMTESRTFIMLNYPKVKITQIYGSITEVQVTLEKMISTSTTTKEFAERMYRQNIGVIGKPSNWLINTNSYLQANQKRNHKLNFIDIKIEEVYALIETGNYKIAAGDEKIFKSYHGKENITEAFTIYYAIKDLIKKYQLSSLTIRCFDVLTRYGNTGCLALALLNSQGISSTCEGDIGATISMALYTSIFNRSSFQANISAVDREKSLLTLAHCTVPFDLIEMEYTLPTHFESDKGVAVRGNINFKKALIFKLLPNLQISYLVGDVVKMPYNDNLCRTQITINAESKLLQEFLDVPHGNHLVVVPFDEDRLTTLLDVVNLLVRD